MEIFTFKKGVFTFHRKKDTEEKTIEYLLPKGPMIYPMVQHIGAPCEALVKKGDRVLVGEKIGEAKAFICAPVHSTVSGIVKDVVSVPQVNGSKVLSVIVENDGLYEEVPMEPVEDYKKLSKEELVERIKEAGIVGMGGAGFPTHVKLSPPPDKNIDVIIINGAECEPYLTSDHRIMLEESEGIIGGIKILLHMFPRAKAYIGIENNKPNAIEKMKVAIKGEKNIQVKALQTKYPQGAEKMMIYAVTKRKVPIGKLPADVGCIVVNIDTAVAIQRAITKGRPLMRRIVTVSGKAIKEPRNFKVRIGTSFREVIEAAGGFRENPVKIIAGGPMMGTALHSLDVPITKGTSAILGLTAEEVALPEEENCIRCGQCVQACPINLLPSMLNDFAIHDNLDMFEKHHGMDCMECGCCTYICPSKRHLVQSLKTAKRKIIANRKKGGDKNGK